MGRSTQANVPLEQSRSCTSHLRTSLGRCYPLGFHLSSSVNTRFWGVSVCTVREPGTLPSFCPPPPRCRSSLSARLSVAHTDLQEAVLQRKAFPCFECVCTSNSPLYRELYTSIKKKESTPSKRDNLPLLPPSPAGVAPLFWTHGSFLILSLGLWPQWPPLLTHLSNFCNISIFFSSWNIYSGRTDQNLTQSEAGRRARKEATKSVFW
jgi:hypothetical protein